MNSPVTHNPKEDAFYEKVDPRGHDWPEDFVKENGRYQHRCGTCGELFFGNKRRFICKQCSQALAARVRGRLKPIGAIVDRKEVAELLFAIEAAIPFVDAAIGDRTCSSSGGPVALRQILEKYNWLEERWRWL